MPDDDDLTAPAGRRVALWIAVALAAGALVGGLAALVSRIGGDSAALSPSSPSAPGTPTAGDAASPTLSPGPASSSNTSPTGTPSATPSPTPTIGPTVGPSSPTSSASPSATAPASATVTVVLERDGLGYVAGAASIRHLPFGGTTRAQAKTLLAAATGTTPTQSPAECGQGARTAITAGRFQMLFDGGHLVGWTLDGTRGRTLRATTADGTGIGTALADLRARYPGVTVTTDTLGPEFTVGATDATPFGGLLDGTAPTSTVTLLYAGETCFAR